MKILMAALAGVALVTAPVAAQAQHGGGHSGGSHGAFHGGGFHGGFHGGGFGDHGFHHGFFYDPFFFGAGLGLGYGYFADPWFWGPPGYWYYGYPGYYQYDYDDGYAPTNSYYRGSMPRDDAAPADNARSPAATPNAPAAKACGAWHWDQAAQKYQWVTDGC